MLHIGRRFRESPAHNVCISPVLSHWRKLLREWCSIQETYCELVPNDSIYWNIERSNLAALAGAAWRLGWAALEEFPQSKRIDRAISSGRADLYLKSPRYGEYIESKMTWFCYRGVPSAAASVLCRKLEAACVDAAVIHERNSNNHRVGVLFAVPYYRKGALHFATWLAALFAALADEQI